MQRFVRVYKTSSSQKCAAEESGTVYKYTKKISETVRRLFAMTDPPQISSYRNQDAEDSSLEQIVWDPPSRERIHELCRTDIVSNICQLFEVTDSSVADLGLTLPATAQFK